MVRAGHKLFFRLSFLSRHQDREPAVPGRLGERVRACACARGGGRGGRAHLCEDEPCLEDGGTGGGGMSTGRACVSGDAPFLRILHLCLRAVAEVCRV